MTSIKYGMRDFKWIMDLVVITANIPVATAKCDQEAANFMALNLMNDIVTGKRTVEDARRAAVEIEKAFRLKGQSSPYTTGFLFPKQSHTADPDVASF
ncbi:hypothetical protein [Neobacillus vireti]|nr:hypothetical protein [Neobacillus vireti]